MYMDDFHEVYLLDISLQSQLYMLKLPHSTKVLGLNPPQLALTFIEFSCSPHLSVGFLQILWLLPP